MKGILASALLITMVTGTAQAAEWLVKSTLRMSPQQIAQAYQQNTGVAVLHVEDLNFAGWYKVTTATESWTGTEAQRLMRQPNVRWVERNRPLRALNPVRPTPNPKDPAFVALKPATPGTDPMLKDQWALRDTGFLNLSLRDVVTPYSNVVAVIDTGIDYNHPDLNHAIWTNPGETGLDAKGMNKATNGIDDDGNGYIDDVMGWDFVDNDQLPYDRTSWMNPGHGTHCSGVIAALPNNGVGIAGIVPHAKIMPLRFLGENGSGTLDGAIKAVKYAVDNGAWVLSNSWGGADPGGDDSLALREAFAYVQAKGRIAVVAAGNDRTNIDQRPASAIPASFTNDNIITVASTTSSAGMSSFSNFGAKLVHIGAPGSSILSTVTGGKYSSMDGTSMAAPHVSAAVALYWAKNPTLNYQQVRAAVLGSATPTPALAGKVVTGGRLNIQGLMQVPAR